jgi:hypothetical protein
MAKDVVGTDSRGDHSASERRRHERLAYRSDHLIELLRDPAAMHDDNPLSAAQGIMNAALLSLSLWATIGAAIWLFRNG